MKLLKDKKLLLGLLQSLHIMYQYFRRIKSSFVFSLLILFVIATYYYKRAVHNSNPPNKVVESGPSPATLPSIAYQKTIFDFGTLLAGELATYKFTFTNTGIGPLIIYEAIPSCNLCTTVSWPTTPIQPGESGAIQVTFNSTGRTGKQGKYIIVRANTEPTDTRLLIRGEVIAHIELSPISFL